MSLPGPRTLAAVLQSGLAAAFLVGLAAPAAHAQDLQIEITNPDADEAQIRAALGSLAADSFRLEDQSDFLEQMADATLLAAKGMGVDYASSPQRFVVGASVGSALSGTGFGFGYGTGVLPSGGFAFQMAITGGLNLGWLAQSDGFARRIVIYGHGMGVSGSRDYFSTRTAAFGGNIQVAVVKPKVEGSVGWGGLQFTTGVSHARYALELTNSVPVQGDTASWEADGRYTVEATGTSLPLELSTNMRLAFLSFFLGGGLDVDFYARGDSEIALEGPISASVNGRTTEVGTASIRAGDGMEFSGVAPRFFTGLQINIFPVKLYGQLNVAGARGFGGHTGLRVVM